MNDSPVLAALAGFLAAYAETHKQLLAEDNRRRQEARADYLMFWPGGYDCHSWPKNLRPYEQIRFQTDSRQQSRARARAKAAGQ